jgi:23S rRNA G2445 N2-methylase RlmL
MSGQHVYRRVDARKALAQGLAGKLPASWRHAEENASVEIWLTIHDTTAVCGLRLSDRTMRHRRYKAEHIPASLRPTLAAALVRLAAARPGECFLDPMCGAGTILAEQLAVGRHHGAAAVWVLGGDLDTGALAAARANLRPFGDVHLASWHATCLPLPDESIHCLVSNPPFGKQLGEPEEIEPLYRSLVPEYNRVLQSGGRIVLLVADARSLKPAAQEAGWKLQRQLHVRILGQRATALLWRKK